MPILPKICEKPLALILFLVHFKENAEISWKSIIYSTFWSFSTLILAPKPHIFLFYWNHHCLVIIGARKCLILSTFWDFFQLGLFKNLTGMTTYFVMLKEVFLEVYFFERFSQICLQFQRTQSK